MDLLLGQRKVMRFLGEALADDEYSAGGGGRGFRSQHQICEGTGMGDSTVRRHCRALKKARYVIGEFRVRMWWYRAVDTHEHGSA